MSWTEIKSLKERRALLYKDALGIREAAKTENRDMTADEAQRHNVATSELEKVNLRLMEAEAGDGDRRMVGMSDDTATVRDADEVRALRADESCGAYLRSRGLSNSYGIGFGQLCRAMVLGGRNAEEKRALSEGTDSAGGFTVPSVLFSDVIDRLRPQAVCMKAGAKVVPLTSDRNSFAKVLTDPTATWRAENASVNAADATFGQVLFQPKTLAVLVKASRELLEDSININSALEMVFANAFAGELDRVALVGASGNGEPVGVENFMAANIVSMGTNGGAITDYSKILDGLQNVEADNASVTGLIMAPRTARVLNGLVDTTGQPLRRPDALANLPFYSTTAVPITQVKGSSGSSLSSIYMGDFSRLWFGVRTSLRVEILREAFASNLQYGFLAYLRADVVASHETAFAKVSGIQ